MSVFTRFAGLAKVLTVFVVLALIAAVVLVFTKNDMERTLTVDFPRTNSLYKGSDVRILGVPVGEVKELNAKGDHVEVTLTYATDVRLPTDVKAVIISPAIVGDRFVQLAPAYSGGAVLPDNARLGIDRSAVPVELDEIFKSLDDLSVALGPEGANKDGSLSSLVEDSAKQLDGQGQQLHTTLTNFAKLSTTLSNNKDELFGSVQEIEQFVALLERNDSSVRSFFDSTARVSNVLEAERDDLAKTLEFLSKALIDVRRLIKDNRTTLRHNVDNLQRLAAVLARRNEEIEHTLIDAPVALGDLGLAGGSSKTGTLDARADIAKVLLEILGNPGDLPALLCNILGEAIPDDIPDVPELCPLLGGLFENLFAANANAAPQQGDAAAGDAADEAEKPSADETIKELQGLLGVQP
ncbi:MAG TPA: MlaD family protein [Acidimicrobiia bacterium]|nr:MlaD family protein [Acidimicrobiia bacterium]